MLLATLVLQNTYLGKLFGFLTRQQRKQPLYYLQDIFQSDDVTIFMSETFREKFEMQYPSVRDR